MMDNKIEIFNNSEFGDLEVIMINNQPYFPAIKCAEVLGYARPHNAVSRHCDDSLKRGVIDSIGRSQEMIYIPEMDLYRLILRSKLPTAKKFETWVVKIVLPTIRKHGAYIDPFLLEELRSNTNRTAILLDQLSAENERNKELTNENRILAPKAKYYDMILENPNSIPITMIAKDYGMSAIAINKILYEHGIQFKMRGTWELYQKYAQKGFTHTNVFVAPNGEQKMHTCWTQRGRLFLYELLKKDGIIPSIEKEAVYEN